jgi:hypothetical protein
VTLSVNKKAGDSIFSISKSAKETLESYIADTP